MELCGTHGPWKPRDRWRCWPHTRVPKEPKARLQPGPSQAAGMTPVFPEGQYLSGWRNPRCGLGLIHQRVVGFSSGFSRGGDLWDRSLPSSHIVQLLNKWPLSFSHQTSVSGICLYRWLWAVKSQFFSVTAVLSKYVFNTEKHLKCTRGVWLIFQLFDKSL